MKTPICRHARGQLRCPICKPLRSTPELTAWFDRVLREKPEILIPPGIKADRPSPRRRDQPAPKALNTTNSQPLFDSSPETQEP
jgi:hypothetical protein